jgi:hypothetical protein
MAHLVGNYVDDWLTFLPGLPWERVYTNWLSFHGRNAQSDLPALLAPQRPQLPGMLVGDAIGSATSG